MPVLMGRDSGLLCVFYTSGERRGVGIPILDLAPCYARFDGCTRYGRGDDREQTWVARFRNQVFAFLTFVNWYTSPHYWWVVWVMAGWGLNLILSLAWYLTGCDEDKDYR